MKKCVEIREMLFKNWKWLFKNTNQTTPYFFFEKRVTMHINHIYMHISFCNLIKIIIIRIIIKLHDNSAIKFFYFFFPKGKVIFWLGYMFLNSEMTYQFIGHFVTNNECNSLLLYQFMDWKNIYINRQNLEKI